MQCKKNKEFIAIESVKQLFEELPATYRQRAETILGPAERVFIDSSKVRTAGKKTTFKYVDGRKSQKS